MSAASAKSSKFANTADEAEKGPLLRTKSQASLINRHENVFPNPPGAFPTLQLNGKDAKGAQESTDKDAAKYSDLNADREGPFAADCAEDAKIWEEYMNQAKISDEELSKVLNSDLDSLLIFAGLFSAILSAFLIEVRKGLQEDLQAKTNDLLLTLIRIQQNPSSPVTLGSSSFAPTLATIRINAFWFVSLILSLLSALGASLAKGWVMQYTSRAPGVSASDACFRHRRFIGITRWHLQMIVQSLPILLHVSFFLFSAGLIILLQDDNIQIANLILTLVVIMAAMYIGSSLLPLIWPDCPFQTPVSILIDRVFKELTGFRNDSTASDVVKSQALSWMLQNSADDSITLRIARAIAGLPATPDVQDALYASQVAGLLVRGFMKHIKLASKIYHEDPLQSSSLVIYLHAILRLVQTRHMDPEISPRLVELAKSGGSLDVDEKLLDDEVLKLVICVRARILLLLGDRTPDDGSENGLFEVRIPVLLKTSRPGLHTAHLLSEVYVMSHPEATKMGNVLDMLRNEDVGFQRDGYRVMLKEADRSE
ncbi:hypothetical protein CPB86DRAFT_178363 [Serendipita vermifera]|nr:hypothetical protein CPB86DRAFT_178363 [Serendipita vermifera]